MSAPGAGVPDDLDGVSVAAARAVLAARAADSRLGVDTLVLEVGNVLAITEYFVITEASNTRLVRALADEVEAQLKEQSGVAPRRVEGRSEASWVLIDYGDVVVHIFLDETRRFYDLERLWSDVPRLDWRPES